jgi:hypothetical protein
VPRTLGKLLGVFYVKLKFKTMEIIIGILLIFYLFLLEKVLEIKEQLNKFEKEIKCKTDIHRRKKR